MGRVRLGFFSFTEVTEPAEHRSYNEWHQLDHMPEQYPLPGVVFGQRWVSTPACRRARTVDTPLLAPVHYMTLYLMGEPVDRTLEEFAALGKRLRELGRFHQHRRSHLSGPFLLESMQAAPRVLVSAEAVAFRPNRGVYIVVRARDDTVRPAAGSLTVESRDGRLPDALAAAEGVAGVWTFGSDPRFDRHPWRPGNRTVTVCYLDEDPVTLSEGLGRVVAEVVGGEAGGGVVLAGPFETITPWHWDWFDDGP